MIDPTQNKLDKFLPLFERLSDISLQQIYLAGGYALLLKQTVVDPTTPLVVPLDRWQNPIARATKDFDFVLDPEVLALVEMNQGVMQALEQQDYQVSEDETEKRWSFVYAKDTPEEIVVDFIAAPPFAPDARLSVEDLRIKNKMALGETGIHARKNASAAGFELQPFQLTVQGHVVHIVNPLTLCTMKLTAMADCQQRAQREADPEKQGKLLADYQKHARDVFRAVALMTRKESDGIPVVLEAIRETPAYRDAAQIFREYFLAAPAIAGIQVQDQWRADDYATIVGILQTWFTP